MKISKRVEFDAGHRLPGVSKCANVHGHRFALEVTLSGATNDGMIVNFADLKKLIFDEVVEPWDHAFFVWEQDLVMRDFLKTLPDHKTIIMSEQPTAENLAASAFDLLNRALAKIEIPVQLERVRLYETPTSWADVDRTDF